MTIEQAIRSALEFENQVRDTYAAAEDRVGNPEAKRFFGVMTREEQGHVDYLESRLGECLTRHAVQTTVEVTSVLADEGWVRTAADGLQAGAGDDRTSTLEYLYQALRLEEKVGGLYRELVANVDDPDAGKMFGRFLEIEDGHLAVVQAEIDFQAGTGIFYGVQEFTLDG